ncbi:MAG: ABC transporter permease [Lactobacillales bacterium]|nr:ABC transporter permease [Lactobacillales bacterium]
MNKRETLQCEKKAFSPNNGEVTAKKLKKALTIYQNYKKRYPAAEENSFYKKDYFKEILPIQPFLEILPISLKNSKMYENKNLIKSQLKKLDSFYKQYSQQTNHYIKIKYENEPKIQKKAMKMNAKVKTPFQLYFGYRAEVFASLNLFISLLVILCTVVIIPTFSNEYETKADVILRCTKHGRRRLALTKIFTLFVCLSALYLVAIGLYLFFSNSLFGWECLKTSVQMIFSTLLNATVGGMLGFFVFYGFLSLLAIISIGLFLSAKCKNSLTAMMIIFVICLFPSIGSKILKVGWLICLFPSAGLGGFTEEAKNTLFCQLSNDELNFLHFAQMSFWSPYVMMATTAFAIPIFIILAVRAYEKHQMT